MLVKWESIMCWNWHVDNTYSLGSRPQTNPRTRLYKELILQLLTQGADSETTLPEVWSRLSTSHTMHWMMNSSKYLRMRVSLIISRNKWRWWWESVTEHQELLTWRLSKLFMNSYLRAACVTKKYITNFLITWYTGQYVVQYSHAVLPEVTHTFLPDCTLNQVPGEYVCATIQHLQLIQFVANNKGIYYGNE